MNPTANLLQLLGCRLPVIQAPMAGVQSSRLALAACRAGALGSLPAAMLTPEKLCAELDALQPALISLTTSTFLPTASPRPMRRNKRAGCRH